MFDSAEKCSINVVILLQLLCSEKPAVVHESNMESSEEQLTFIYVHAYNPPDKPKTVK